MRVGGTLTGMRIPSVLLAAVTACALTGALTACSGATMSSAPADVPTEHLLSVRDPPPRGAGSALDLVGTAWHVEGGATRRSGSTASP